MNDIRASHNAASHLRDLRTIAMAQGQNTRIENDVVHILAEILERPSRDTDQMSRFTRLSRPVFENDFSIIPSLHEVSRATLTALAKLEEMLREPAVSVARDAFRARTQVADLYEVLSGYVALKDDLLTRTDRNTWRL